MIIGALLIFLICLPSLVHAQPDPGCDPLDPSCPMDGGVIALLIAGIGYGVKKIRDARKKVTQFP